MLNFMRPVVLAAAFLSFAALAQDAGTPPTLDLETADSHYVQSVRLFNEAVTAAKTIDTIRPGSVPPGLGTVIKKLMDANREAMTAVRVLFAEIGASYRGLSTSLQESQAALRQAQASGGAVSAETLDKVLRDLELIQKELNNKAQVIESHPFL